MKLHPKLALVTGVVALGLAPAAAFGVSYHPEGPNYQPEGPNHHTEGPSYHPSNQPHGKAYGWYCKGQSKKHVKGEKGTAFSRCVKAMARADHNDELTGREACKALSKKHVKGAQGTPFSRCVKGVAQMRKDQAQS